jgi:hypothetical protein
MNILGNRSWCIAIRIYEQGKKSMEDIHVGSAQDWFAILQNNITEILAQYWSTRKKKYEKKLHTALFRKDK